MKEFGRRNVDTVAAILRQRVSAIIRTNEADGAPGATQAAVDGGFRMVEFTLTTGALELVAEFSRRPDLLVRAGTVLTVDQARRAVDAGASFLVSPAATRPLPG